MDYLQTPSNYNSNSYKKVQSPTTAHSKYSSPFHSSANLMQNVKSELQGIIAQAQRKKEASHAGLSAVYRANQEAIYQLDPERRFKVQDYENRRAGNSPNLMQQNKELRKQLNDALRQILRLNQIIAELQSQNNYLRRKAGIKNMNNPQQLLADLEELRAQGQSLRQNTIRLLKNK